MRGTNAWRAVKSTAYILLALSAAAAVIWIVWRYRRPQGLYVEDGEMVLTETSDVALEPDGAARTFRIGRGKGFGSYSVTDCTVKIVPNADEAHDFDFTVSGEAAPYRYGAEDDLSAAFGGSNGQGLPVASDGTFAVTVQCLTMPEILNAVYPGKTVTVEKEIGGADFGQYPYFALSVTSPDGSETLRIPFRYHIAVLRIELDKEVIVL